MGFRQVYDYVPGKSDWLAAGLPREGHAASLALAGDVVRPASTCHLDERLSDVTARVQPHELGGCVVLNAEGIVLGRLRREQLESTADVRVQEIMQPGPTTVRASEGLQGLVERMRDRGVRTLLVTTPEGKLIGLLDRQEAEHRLHAAVA